MPDLDWRSGVLDELTAGLANCFVVEDPDNLMTETGIQSALLARGYQFYPFTDSIEFRYFYESQIRNRSTAPLVISVDGDTITSRQLPFDVTQSAKVVSLSLGNCFPDIHPTILRSLPSAELDALHTAIRDYTPGKLSAAASADFALRHIYQIATELIQSPADLLRTLLRTHYRDIALPASLCQRMVEHLQRKPAFAHWPLLELLTSRPVFFSFLQSHWSAYLQAAAESLEKGINEPETRYWQGTVQSLDALVLPYGHDDVRIYVDNLFLEGFLYPVELEQADKLARHWSLVGIRQDPDKQQRQRAQGLLNRCRETLPEADVRHQAWLQFAHRWAELNALYATRREWVDEPAFLSLRATLDHRFQQWLLAKYASLPTQPPQPPTMLHHIPRVMARELAELPETRVALIVIDGLALDQWVSLQQELALEATGSVVTESAVFAWVPTITSVSRQALFAARLPYQFAKTIHTTAAEPKLWQQFWQEQGLREDEVFYAKNLGTDNVDYLLDRLSDHRLRAAGLVINTVDDTMHGMALGNAGMHVMVRQWGKTGYLHHLLQGLLAKGYSIHLTADHGNVEATGWGRVADGATADARGERVRVYSTETLCTAIQATIPSALAWPQTGLPADYWPLLLAGRGAFVSAGETLVGHGGITLEEVTVPYIKVSRG